MTLEQLREYWAQKEEQFRNELDQERSLRIEEVDSDGNCLFRAVAYQVYGDEDMCYFLRDKCMDYILACHAYFKDFIDLNVDGSIQNYCDRKRQDKVWGDDLEIEALSEMYGRPIEIYAYSSQPMRTFHE